MKGLPTMVAARTDWADDKLLQENKQNLRLRYLKKLRAYEARYELRSTVLEAVVAAGELRETSEVADWLITYRAFRKLGYAL